MDCACELVFGGGGLGGEMRAGVGADTVGGGGLGGEIRVGVETDAVAGACSLGVARSLAVYGLLTVLDCFV